MKKDHFEAALEYFNDKLDMIIEAIAPLGPMQIKMNEMDDRLSRVESDVTIIKRVVKEHSRELSDHDLAIHRLILPEAT
jgi:hypothetical protein